MRFSSAPSIAAMTTRGIATWARRPITEAVIAIANRPFLARMRGSIRATQPARLVA